MTFLKCNRYLFKFYTGTAEVSTNKTTVNSFFIETQTETVP